MKIDTGIGGIDDSDDGVRTGVYIIRTMDTFEDRPSLKLVWYSLTIFISSGLLMVLEITAGRLLAPYIGVSLYTWTSIIGVVLAGLSLGNWIGGIWVDRGGNERAVGITLVIGGATSLLLLLLLKGVAGLGDVALTCNAMQSRNFSLGYELGQGRAIDDILASRKTVTEGYFNAESVTELARRNQVDMPICQAVEAVLEVEADLDAIIHGLLSRPLVHE